MRLGCLQTSRSYGVIDNPEEWKGFGRGKADNLALCFLGLG